MAIAAETLSSQERRLEQLLLERELLAPADLTRVRLQKSRTGDSLATALVASGVIEHQALREVLSEFYDVPAVNLDTTFGDPLILDTIPKEKAFELKVLPLFLVGNQLTVATCEPSDLGRLNELRFLTGKDILPVLALETDLDKHLAEYFGELDPDSGEMAIEFESDEGEALDELQLDQGDEDRPIIRLVNLILARAIQECASDIHLEPAERGLRVRFRVDGSLQPKPFTLNEAAAAAITSRIKILSSIDITERRIPQDGKVRVRYRGRQVDIRVSTFPTIHGEKVVMRLLDKERQDFTLDSLDMSREILERWTSLLHRRQGILLVTGPTGSGKSTTLYATLRHLNRPDVNIVTLEDPVEYELSGTAQGQVNVPAGFTFAKGLRSILRQDPDIILVGEIRDEETAQIAAQAAQTGHLVLATLHTNDAAASITRLGDMGLPRYLIAASVIGVLAQRLARRVCPGCAAETAPGEHEARFLAPWLERGVPYVTGRGCEKCLDVGYRGRVGVHELLTVSPKIQRLITAEAGEEEIRETARREGYRRLWWDGLSKVRQRITTLKELAAQVEQDLEPLGIGAGGTRSEEERHVRL